MSYAVSVHADLGCLQPSFGIVSNIFLNHIYAFLAQA
jgi:hypothetical protein